MTLARAAFDPHISLKAAHSYFCNNKYWCYPISQNFWSQACTRAEHIGHILSSLHRKNHQASEFRSLSNQSSINRCETHEMLLDCTAQLHCAVSRRSSQLQTVSPWCHLGIYTGDWKHHERHLEQAYTRSNQEINLLMWLSTNLPESRHGHHVLQLEFVT